jgi:hypothetical protein
MADLAICILGIIVLAVWSLRFLSLLISETFDFWLNRGGGTARQKRQE